jgi:hypothetical protein
MSIADERESTAAAPLRRIGVSRTISIDAAAVDVCGPRDETLGGSGKRHGGGAQATMRRATPTPCAAESQCDFARHTGDEIFEENGSGPQALDRAFGTWRNRC